MTLAEPRAETLLDAEPSAAVASEAGTTASGTPAGEPPAQSLAPSLTQALTQALAMADLTVIETDMLAVLSARIDALGADGSGLGAYYARQIAQGQVFSDNDRMLLGVLPYNFLEFETVVEAGAGFGQLGLALGILGRRVTCVEVGAGRFACMAALKNGLEATYPQLATNVTLVHGTWPYVPAGVELTRALLVAVDFVFSGPDDSEAKAIEALKRYGGAIIDASHFVHTRLDPAERQRFYDAIAAGGLPVPSRLPPYRNDRQSDYIFVTPG